MKKHLIPAIFFSVWTIFFGTLFYIQELPMWAPILTGISGLMFWGSFLNDLRIEKKNKQAD